MNSSLQRRINVANCWASTRIALLDGFERYEDSYAITQEFREWLTCMEEHPEHLKDSVLRVPKGQKQGEFEESIDTDEMLEI